MTSNTTGVLFAAGASSSAVTDHLTDTTDAHDASAISVVPAGTIAATDVQGAIEELALEALYGGSLANAAALTALPKASLIAGQAYRVGDTIWVWDPAATTANGQQPADTTFPGTDPGWWVATSGHYRGTYSSTAPYTANDIVFSAGSLWRANSHRDAGTWPGGPTEGESGPSSWTRVTGPVQGPFNFANAYAVGELVYDASGAIGAVPGIYRNVVAHNALDAPNPANWAMLGGAANDRVFAPLAGVAPVDPLNPTLANIQAWVTGQTLTDTIVYYTGTATSTDPIRYVYHVDNSGTATLIERALSSVNVEVAYAHIQEISVSNTSQAFAGGAFTSTQNTSTLQPATARVGLSTRDLVTSRGVTVGANDITITQGGVYSLAVSADFEFVSNSPASIQLIKNGTTVLASATAFFATASTDNATIPATAVWVGELAAGNTLDVRGFSNAGTISYASFSLSLVQSPSAVLIDPAVTVGTPATVTATGGVTTINGGATATVYEGVPTVITLDVAPASSISVVIPTVGTANVLNANTGQTLVYIPPGGGNQSIAVTVVPRTDQPLTYAYIQELSTSNSTAAFSTSGHTSTQDTTVLQPIAARVPLGARDVVQGSGITVGADTMTITTPGQYRADITFDFDFNSNNPYSWQLVKNSTTVLATASNFPSNAAGNMTAPASGVWRGALLAGDTLDIRVLSNTAGSLGVTSCSILVEQVATSVSPVVDAGMVTVETLHRGRIGRHSLGTTFTAVADTPVDYTGATSGPNNVGMTVNVATSSITATQAGTYRAYGTAFLRGSTGSNQLGIYVNGTVVVRGDAFHPSVADDDHMITVSGHVALSAGDIVTLCPVAVNGTTWVAGQFLVEQVPTASVVDPGLTPVIDDDSFVLALPTNVPSAESVKAYVDALVLSGPTAAMKKLPWASGGFPTSEVWAGGNVSFYYGGTASGSQVIAHNRTGNAITINWTGFGAGSGSLNQLSGSGALAANGNLSIGPTALVLFQHQERVITTSEGEHYKLLAIGGQALSGAGGNFTLFVQRFA